MSFVFFSIPQFYHGFATPATRGLFKLTHYLILIFKQWFFKGHYTRREVLFTLMCRYGTKGIEIGACHHPMRLWRKFNDVRFLDIETKEAWKAATVGLPPAEIMQAVDVDIIDDANTLATIHDNSLDFLIANHVFEHCRNPISTLGNMFRVLKPEGALYLSIPDKRFTFDASRESTSIEHFCYDYEKGPEGSDEAHYREWARMYDKLTDPQKSKDAPLNCCVNSSTSISTAGRLWKCWSFS